ncbi:unnamed protein product [Kluyveromyces dobzhanskii CBS 2104]|uniref:non-specific serine/threonine protein kinase n=1 Tax=Kluyveromyces dobzhanskii CBS 2104 TaxID=1427455 RepID=A0A0A8LA59_9SACH|nr:unnamed protein product [Kluyveromyces dobzhanskii CBS 2104]
MSGSSTSGTGSMNNVTSMFKRKEIIGRGKFGVVYMAYHTKTQHVYAIKVLNLDNTEDEVEDIRKEIQFLSCLKQTPNITHYYGSYLNDTKLWVIMEYCAGGSLRTLLRPGIIEEKYIGVIMREILVALISIHRDNVIHRDIKAANVLIANNGNVKLCDFGVAAQLSQSTLKRQTMAGTPYWMAPEVIMEGVYYDTKVDIWSLGITAYEIATGNPPYCHMEAIRAMQMITKSNPPRLEGREYSQPLKEFIALCLDEDPKERPSAEELYKSKLIKQDKGTSTMILKELITRYLLFREKNEQYKHEEEPHNSSKQNPNSSIEGNSSHDASSFTENEPEEIDIKWDFDSLSSREYILENDINVDAIPEEADWIKYSHQEVNYAYPEEEYYNSNKPFFPYYQGSTIGRTFNNNPNTAQLSTIQANNNNSTKLNSNAPTNQQNSHFTKHYQNTTTGTANHFSRHTGTNTHGTSKRSETKASKQLLQLFEDNPEEVYDFPKLSKTMSSFNIPPNGSSHVEHDNDSRPDMRNLHSQSTPALSILQTNFKSNLVGPGSSSVLPTPIEIEIPEELPVSSNPVLTLNTKPRSSTVSSMSQKATPVLQRRPTISGQPSAQLSSLRPDVVSATNSKLAGTEETSAPNSNGVPNNGSNLTNKNLFGSAFAQARSPSPTRGLAGVSPEKKSLDPLLHQASIYSNTPPVMKQLNSTNDVLLQSMNTLVEKKEKEGESSRIHRDFKKQHPNLKLQMPSPTTLLGSNKLLDSAATLDESSHQHQPNSATGSVTAQTVNQFGINTSNAQIPVAMTPVGEKRFGDLTKPRKRSTSSSTLSRTGSITNDHVHNPANNPLGNIGPSSVATNAGTGNGSVGEFGTTTTNPMSTVAGSSNASTTNSCTSIPSASTSVGPLPNMTMTPVNVPSGAGDNSSATGNTTATSTNVTSTIPSSNALLSTTPSSLSLVMDPPPKQLSMNIFIDVPDDHHIDRKPIVLSELDTLLKLFEDGLSVMELTLQNSLPQDSPEE